MWRSHVLFYTPVSSLLHVLLAIERLNYLLCLTFLSQLNRINRAREQGWRHVLSSSGGSSPERKVFMFIC